MLKPGVRHCCWDGSSNAEATVPSEGSYKYGLGRYSQRYSSWQASVSFRGNDCDLRAAVDVSFFTVSSLLMQLVRGFKKKD